MEYTKEFLIKKAIDRLDTIDEVLEDCQNLIKNVYAEKQVVRYLLWLGAERKEKIDT